MEAGHCVKRKFNSDGCKQDSEPSKRPCVCQPSPTPASATARSVMEEALKLIRELRAQHQELRVLHDEQRRTLESVKKMQQDRIKQEREVAANGAQPRGRCAKETAQMCTLEDLIAKERRLWQREKLSLGRFEELSDDDGRSAGGGGGGGGGCGGACPNNNNLPADSSSKELN